MLVRTLEVGQTMEFFGLDGRSLGHVGVIEVRGEKAKLGFQFPRSIGIYPSPLAVFELRGNRLQEPVEQFAEVEKSAA